MVEEYLTDRDQEEALRNWWKENWRWIFGGIVLGLALGKPLGVTFAAWLAVKGGVAVLPAA